MASAVFISCFITLGIVVKLSPYNAPLHISHFEMLKKETACKPQRETVSLKLKQGNCFVSTLIKLFSCLRDFAVKKVSQTLPCNLVRKEHKKSILIVFIKSFRRSKSSLGVSQEYTSDEICGALRFCLNWSIKGKR